MGSVYRAHDLNLGVDVAVKENLFTTEDYAAQFRLEATLLANLRHPNLPRVTDHFVLEEEGQYLVMDYIEGEDLRQILERRGVLPEDEVIRIGLAMCDALSYLHSRTPPVLHRDIKLGNVKIAPDGGIFLVDFGLAKIMQGDQPTMTAARAMTPGYSPPEQYGSARTDARSDIYSLGATLYAASTGFIPEDSLARAIDGLKLTPLLKRNAKISPQAAQAIEKALETTAANRYQNAQEFHDALMGAPVPAEKSPSAEAPTAAPVFPPDAEPASRPAATQRRRSLGWTPLLLAVLVAVASGLIYTNRALAPAEAETPSATNSLTATSPAATRTPTPSATATPRPSATPAQPIVIPPAQSPAPSPTLAPSPTPLPDGSGPFAFVSTRQGPPEIYLSPGSETQSLSSIAQGACQPAWSPDASQIAYVSPCHARAIEYPNASIFFYDLASKSNSVLPSVPGGDYDPAFSPDGEKLAFTSLRDGYAQIYVLDLKTQSLLRLVTTDKTQPVRQPVWSPDGAKIAYAQMRYGAWTIWTVGADGSSPAQLIRSGADANDFSPLWLKDGTTLLFTQNRRGETSPAFLIQYNLQTGKSSPLLPDRPVDEISLSPGGGWLLFRSSDGSNLDIYQLNLADLSVSRLTTDPAEDFDPVWQP